MTAPIVTTSSDWIAIRKYREFWDVPRMFLIDSEYGSLLFDCPFDETLEDYGNDYRVFLMPILSDADLEESWANLPSRAVRFLGSIPISKVHFDATNRSFIDRRTLSQLFADIRTGNISSTVA
jgi:hypothetical protein